MRTQISKGGLLSSGASRALPREGAPEAHEAPRIAPSPLPQWESFALPDRRRLVGLLIQAARRQVPPGATARVRAAQG
jgi:hypothetical protein